MPTTAAMAILVTGAAGYIGSVVTDCLLDAGELPVALDDLSLGHRDAVDPSVPFYTGSMGDSALVHHIVRTHGVTACVHLAGCSAVGESVTAPARYYANNLGQGAVFFGALSEAGVRHVVLSSTAAVYGFPEVLPIPEAHPQRPVNPYGWTKRALEQVLQRLDVTQGLRSVSLRYFNAAGATVRRCERHTPESHLVPLALQAASGRRGALTVFGTDYNTPDGTALRDYIHVTDLARAHLLAMKYLREGGATTACNLGRGEGRSVAEVIAAVGRVTGRKVPVTLGPRREGDPPELVADVRRAREVLGWAPEITHLDDLVASAWQHETLGGFPGAGAENR